ncbi:hypothetical protein LCGC14_2915170 [marine sediment metagenome]|uniref:Uncharacterized protein n=1 Tax=marine sediment metagenome TaxID=412755 RepID=A0A0F9AGK8_9ZZZZ
MNYMFSVPNLPRPIYDRLKAIAADLDFTHQQMVILGVLAMRKLSSIDQPALDALIKQVSGMYALDLNDDPLG